jgi:Sigma-54 interaction domain
VRSKAGGRSERGEVARAIPGKDLRRLVSSGANLLVRGDKSVVMATVVAMSADFPPPLTTWIAGENAPLPDIDRGTLVIHEVDGLDLVAQRTLLEWLEQRATRVRLITTATADLFAMVSAGAFVDQLYYRLNTIIIDAVAGDAQSAPQLTITAPPSRPRQS